MHGDSSRLAYTGGGWHTQAGERQDTPHFFPRPLLSILHIHPLWWSLQQVGLSISLGSLSCSSKWTEPKEGALGAPVYTHWLEAQVSLAGACEWSLDGMDSLGVWPSTCGVCYHVQVDSVRQLVPCVENPSTVLHCAYSKTNNIRLNWGLVCLSQNKHQMKKVQSRASVSRKHQKIQKCWHRNLKHNK